MRYIIVVMLILSASPSLIYASSYPKTITDITGRKVTFNAAPKHIALSTGRVFPLLEILFQEQAGEYLSSLRDDMRTSAPSMYKLYRKKYPRLETLPRIGAIKTGEFDAERFINQKPRADLFLMDLSNVKAANDNGLIEKLDHAGVNVIAIDFREDPFKNTVDSVRSVAEAVGRSEQGEAFIRYYNSHLQVIKDGLIDLKKTEKKRVFIERSAGKGDNCCNTFGSGNFGAYLPFLKAENIANKPLKGAATGTMSAESIIVSRPDVYIMATTGWIDEEGRSANGIPLGYLPNEKLIAQGTKKIMQRKWLPALKSYQDKNIFSIYMPFYNSPYNLVALEYFAKWIYPKRFAALDPNKTFEEMNATLADHEVSGIFGQNNFTLK